MSDSLKAREDWESRISQRSDAVAVSSTLLPPTVVEAASGTGHIRLWWEPVPGAAGRSRSVIAASSSDTTPASGTMLRTP